MTRTIYRLRIKTKYLPERAILYTKKMPHAIAVYEHFVSRADILMERRNIGENDWRLTTVEELMAEYNRGKKARRPR